MAEMIGADALLAPQPGGGHRPLVAALGFSVSLHLILLAGLHVRLATAVRPPLRPAPLTAYLAPPAPLRAAAPSARPALASAAQPKRARARRHARPAVAARPPMHPAPVTRQPASRRERTQPEALPAPEPHPARRSTRHPAKPPLQVTRPSLRRQAVRPVPHPFEPRLEAAAPAASRQVTRPASPVARPHTEAALRARHSVRRPAPAPLRSRPPDMTRRAGPDDAGAPVEAPSRAASAPRRQAHPYGDAYQPGRIVAGGGAAAPDTPPSASAAAPGSDIRVLGRGRATPSGRAAGEGPAGEAAGGQGDRPLALLNPVHPVYPPAARRDNVEGTVVVRIWVDAAGDVTNVQVLRASPPGYFETAAIDAVRQWHFAPALRHGHPVASVVPGKPLLFRLLDTDG